MLETDHGPIENEIDNCLTDSIPSRVSRAQVSLPALRRQNKISFYLNLVVVTAWTSTDMSTQRMSWQGCYNTEHLLLTRSSSLHWKSSQCSVSWKKRRRPHCGTCYALTHLSNSNLLPVVPVTVHAYMRGVGWVKSHKKSSLRIYSLTIFKTQEFVRP
jgi:hypothetical protein